MINNAKKLDQFYTNTNIAESCFADLIGILKNKNIKNPVWLEPSAGNGAFYSIMPEPKLGIDIDPKIKGILKKDFLTFILPDNNYITLGNPPFGQNSSIAIKFFNRCAEKSEIIAFIVPKTFRKDSVKNKLDLNMHLIFEKNIESHSFNLNNHIVDVPCVFQIWEKRNELREKVIPLNRVKGMTFCNKENADIAFQRVGVNAGTIKDKSVFPHISKSSHLFIKLEDLKDIEVLKNIDWSDIKYNTAGNPSISKSELIKVYMKIKHIT